MLTQLTHRVPVIVKALMDRKLNGCEQLTQDHIKVETLFLRFKILATLCERVPSRRQDFIKRQELVIAQIYKELEQHTAAEEAILYRECETHKETRAMALECYEEHKQVKTLLKDLSALSMNSEAFQAKFTLLVEDFTHHVREEEAHLFPMMRIILSPPHLLKMGTQLRNHKKHAQREASRHGKAA